MLSVKDSCAANNFNYCYLFLFTFILLLTSNQKHPLVFRLGKRLFRYGEEAARENSGGATSGENGRAAADGRRKSCTPMGYDRRDSFMAASQITVPLQVCIQALEIPNNPNFVKFHFKKSSENKDAFYRRRRVMFTMPDGNSIYSLNLDNLLLSSDENYSDIGDLVAPEVDLVRTEFPCGRIEGLLYCEGLLLCKLGKPEQLYLVNPATGEAKKLPEGPKYFDHKGFGFDHSADDYKVVCAVYSKRVDTFDFSVYSLKTVSWRVVKSPIQYNDADTTHGVLLNGSVHWVMTKVGKESSPVIVSFHLAEEEFREIPLPLKGSGFIPNEYYVLGVFRDCLCLTRCDDFKIHDEFWVMKDYGIRQSWTNIKTSFRYSELYHTSFWKDSHDLLLLDYQFGMYDFYEKSFRNLSVQEFPEFENAGIYMESLVSPNYYGSLDPEHET